MNLSLLNLKYFITGPNISNLCLSELGFILTVLRDNCLNDEVYIFLDKTIKELPINK